MSQIKWAYDENSGSFSALPASPFLLLALGAVALLPLLEEAYNKQKFKPQPLPPDFDWNLYNEYKQKYHELKAKKISGQEFNYADTISWQRVIYPPWHNEPGRWSYD